jgi:hypothetical protein
VGQEVRREERGILKHIIIETALGKGISESGNMGDVSMLQVAEFSSSDEVQSVVRLSDRRKRTRSSLERTCKVRGELNQDYGRHLSAHQ